MFKKYFLDIKIANECLSMFKNYSKHKKKETVDGWMNVRTNGLTDAVTF